MTSLDMSPASKKQLDGFSQKITKEAEQLISNVFPEKIAEMDKILQGSCSLKDLSVVRAPLDIPIPDPVKEELKKKKKKEEKEAKDGKKGGEKGEEEDEGPPCGPIACNETVEKLFKLIKPEIQILKECLNTVSMWIQLQVPRIEDGNNFGVSVQEKVFELLTNTRTKIEGFQTQISKYYSERGDAVAKASKQPHVGDFRQLVHELDQHQYCELRIVALEIRNTYAMLYDVIIKNFDKIKKPRGDLSSKALIY
ncbi:proteasome activator complex subunit 1 [Pimephales promelas]|uniref:proteasome activator complex subunit 1 n=1 Tax=Pimephales promelas TaxID=90988 RepID=UPI0019556CB7|nr:proteasome activator complex subunit 1 [Pimephales promelas]KAG1953872.1 proteasome activator complex subunit [Pimephales promelas]